jgi:hypothetical protein
MKNPKLETPVTAPGKRGRGRPRKEASLKPEKRRGRPPKATNPKTHNKLLDNNLLGESNLNNGLVNINPDEPEIRSARSLKDEITEKEKKFLEIYLAGGITKDKAMILAGYGHLSPSGRRYVSGKICQKYETQAGDHRDIFRALGAGEIAVVKGLLDLAQTAKSENVRRQAWADIAQCLGLKKEQIESFLGVQVIIKGRDDQPEAGQDQAASKSTPAPPPKPMQIIR